MKNVINLLYLRHIIFTYTFLFLFDQFCSETFHLVSIKKIKGILQSTIKGYILKKSKRNKTPYLFTLTTNKEEPQKYDTAVFLQLYRKIIPPLFGFRFQ